MIAMEVESSKHVNNKRRISAFGEVLKKGGKLNGEDTNNPWADQEFVGLFQHDYLFVNLISKEKHHH